jgi:hypothetical protein
MRMEKDNQTKGRKESHYENFQKFADHSAGHDLIYGLHWDLFALCGGRVGIEQGSAGVFSS